MTTPRPVEDGEAVREWRSLLIVLVFLILGPPLGVLVVMLPAIRMSTLTSWISNLLGATMFAYLVGGLQAFFVGVIAAACQRRTRSKFVPLLPVLAAGLVTGIAFLAFLSWKDGHAPPTDFDARFLVIHVGASVGCWLIANALLWWDIRRRTRLGLIVDLKRNSRASE